MRTSWHILLVNQWWHNRMKDWIDFLIIFKFPKHLFLHFNFFIFNVFLRSIIQKKLLDDETCLTRTILNDAINVFFGFQWRKRQWRIFHAIFFSFSPSRDMSTQKCDYWVPFCAICCINVVIKEWDNKPLFFKEIDSFVCVLNF